MDTVVVMLSTYNGERFLREQVESILAQTGVMVRLVVRDDGSKDSTPDILKKYEREYPNVEVHLGKNVGYIESFMWLVQYCGKFDNCFYSFSDQDDIWDPQKLSSAVEMIKAQVNDCPVMYYSDLKVVDETDHFIRMANTWEGTIDRYKLAMFIGIRGCTMVYNQILENELAKYYPGPISGHDTYIALLAFWSGIVVYDKNAYIHYRQTGNNLSITGVNKIDKFKKNLLYVKKRMTVRANIHEKNAVQVLKGHEAIVRDAGLLRLVADYKKSFFGRIRLILRREFWNFSFQIKLFNLFFILVGKL